MKLKDIKQKRGITLIALVITIIILLILAGITIGSLGGENGLIARAKQAREETRKEQALETINLKVTNIQISSWAETEQMPTLQYVADKLCEDDDMHYVRLATQEKEDLEKIIVGENTSIFVKLIEYEYEFEINQNLQIFLRDGVKVEVPDNSQDLTELKTKIQGLQQKIIDIETSKEEMQQKLTTLETANTQMKQQIQNTKNDSNNRFNSIENQFENILTDVDVNTRTTLYEGTAGTKGTTYTMSDISSYKYLIVYADVYNGSVRCCRTSRIIKVSDIVYNNTSTAIANSTFVISEIASIATNNNFYFGVAFYFKTSNSFFVQNLYNAGWTSPRIYKIEGLK